MPLTLQDVRQLGMLASIAMDPSEEERVLAQLHSVFGVLERLQAVDTQGVEPLTHPHASALRLRDDAVTEVVQREDNQRSAPAVQDGLYLVPRVID